LWLYKYYTREDKGVRELLPHIGPIPILIPLKIFLAANGGKLKFEITHLILRYQKAEKLPFFII